MNRKKRNLLLLLAATLAVAGLFWFLASGDSAQEEENGHDHSVSESDGESGRQSGVLLNYSSDNIKSVTITNSQAKYTAYVDSKSGSVAFKELKGYPVNENFMETVWYDSVQMIYQDIVATTKDDGYRPEEYGFDKPSVTVKVTLKDGHSYTFHGGKETPGYENDVYYVKVSGDQNIYVCTLDSAFFMGDSYYLSDDIFYRYDTESDGKQKSKIRIGEITLTGDAFKGEFRMKPSTTADMSSPFYGFSYRVTSPVSWPVKASASSMLVYDLQYLMADDVAVLKPTAKQLKAYGLDKPYLTLSFRRNGKEVVMYGSKSEGEKMYVILKDHDILYELNTNSLSILHQLTPENLYSINAISATMEALSGIKITSASVNCDIAIAREENSNALEADDVIYTYSVTKNGEDKKYSSFIKLMKQLNGSSITRWNVKKPAGKPMVTITLSFFENIRSKPEVIRLYQYSDREYAVVREGLPVNTVSATWVKQLLADADAF
ncbi:MAG: DUF4340 domain-containing protein [Clostridia bacterium]|nr:DUF4340 domain-containing protein [Clostridia bacterium]